MSYEQLVNTKWNENILEAKRGIGGHCLPKDTVMYHELSKHILPTSTILARFNPTRHTNITSPNKTSLQLFQANKSLLNKELQIKKGAKFQM